MKTISTSKGWFEGRIVQMLGAAWFMALALFVSIEIAASPMHNWLAVLSRFCLACFYMLLALLIMTRSPAKAQAQGVAPRVAAFVGTYLPWSITFFGRTDQALPNLASTVCVLFGIIMMLVAIRHLGRSFSLVPQARSVVQTGPYKWIKHPLYLAEQIAILGVVLQYPTPLTMLIFVLHFGVQVCRILYEEDLLRRNCPEYSSYEASRWRLVPYVW